MNICDESVQYQAQDSMCTISNLQMKKYWNNHFWLKSVKCDSIILHSISEIIDFGRDGKYL